LHFPQAHERTAHRFAYNRLKLTFSNNVDDIGYRAYERYHQAGGFEAAIREQSKLTGKSADELFEQADIFALHVDRWSDKQVKKELAEYKDTFGDYGDFSAGSMGALNRQNAQEQTDFDTQDEFQQ